MQMQIVDTNAGVAISAAPSSMARTMGFRCAMLRWTFSISTVASSTRMPTASAMPPRVMTFSVSPSQERMTIDTRIDSGIETTTMSVLRQLPRKTRSITAVSAAAMHASLTTPCTAARTKIDWSKSSETLSSLGSRLRVVGRVSRTRLTTSRVLALPSLRIDMRTDFLPSTCTMFVCGVFPSRTCATSRMNTVVPRTTLIGIDSSCSRSSGLALRTIGYSSTPIFAVPVGTITFCSPRAALTSRGDSPHA